METGGVLERLVLALGHRDHHHPQAFAQVVGSGANQIADVFDHQQLQARQGDAVLLQRLNAPLHHPRLQVAGLACADLHRRQAGGPEAPGVVIGGQIAHDHGHGRPAGRGAAARGLGAGSRLGAPGPITAEPLQQGGFAGAWPREQVHHGQLGRGEAAAIGGRLLVVAAQQALAQVQPPANGWLRSALAAAAIHTHGARLRGGRTGPGSKGAGGRKGVGCGGRQAGRQRPVASSRAPSWRSTQKGAPGSSR